MKIKCSIELIGPDQWTSLDSSWGHTQHQAHTFEIDFDGGESQHEYIAAAIRRLIVAVNCPRVAQLLAVIVDDFCEDEATYDGVPSAQPFFSAAKELLKEWELFDKPVDR